MVRLVGPGVKPWMVPLRSLAKALQSVQRLLEPDEPADQERSVRSAEEPKQDKPLLYLLDVVAKSATYPVGTPDPERLNLVLGDTARAINSPGTAQWSERQLSSIESLSDIARALTCRIESRKPGSGSRMGDVIATISQTTYQSISQTAFVYGETSVLGRVERVGGAQNLHCGLRLRDQPNKMVICKVKGKDLAQQLGSHLYEDIVLSGPAIWYRRDWRLYQLTATAFEPPQKGIYPSSARSDSASRRGCMGRHRQSPSILVRVAWVAGESSDCCH